MSIAVLAASMGHGGCGLADHAHAAVDDGVRHEAFAREGRIVARAPDRAAEGFEGDERAGAGGLGLD